MAGITRLNARMNRRRVLAASGGAMLGATVLGNVSLAVQDSEVTVTMVTDTAGVGDQNFNDLAVLGGNRAAEELGVEFQIQESQTQADYAPNLALGGESSDLTIAVGALLGDAVAEVAPQFPDKFFAILDGVVELDNVYSVVFREHEGSFLGGVLAALTSQSGVLGIIGGIRVPPVARYENGFIAGARTINPDIEVLISYADSFEDPALGQDLTLAQFNNGADVILPIAGRTGVGSFDAVKEQGEGFWIVAGDTDQSHLAPGQQLAAIKKGVDVAFFDATQAVVNGSFPGGTVDDLGLADGGMDIYAFDPSVEQSVLDTVAAYKQAIIDGVLEPPATDEELAAFEPTPLDVSATPAAATPAS